MVLLNIKWRRGPWSWKGLMQQCRDIPGQESRRGLIGEQGEEMAYGTLCMWGGARKGEII